MEFNSLTPSLRVFLSRRVVGSNGEDLVEKQNAEQGSMPVIEDEAGTYGYTLENRHMVNAFRAGTQPLETFHDGIELRDELRRVGSDDFDLAERGPVKYSDAFARCPHFDGHGRLPIRRVALVPVGSFPSTVLHDGAQVPMRSVGRQVASWAVKIAARAGCDGRHSHTDVGRSKGGRADVGAVETRQLREHRKAIDVGGTSLVGAHSKRGVAFQMFGRTIIFRYRERNIRKLHVILQIDPNSRRR